MPSRFPGMDPYLESPDQWSDFHGTFVRALRDAINERLPKNYLARLGEYVSLITPVQAVPTGDAFVPDVAVLQGRRRADASEPGARTTAVLGTPEPYALQNVDFKDRRTEPYVTIIRLPRQDLVTVVELLSPTNKYGEGRSDYMQKRREFREQGVSLVELDFLRAGQRISFSERLRVAHYYAMTNGGNDAKITQAYPWTVRDKMPAIPIPLKAPDPDVVIPLSEPFAVTYDRGRYDELIDYSIVPPAPAFAAKFQDWIATICETDGTQSFSQ